MDDKLPQNNTTPTLAPTQTPKPPAKAFLNSINHFRGIAIIFIVMAHCYRPAGWEIETFADKAWFNLMMNGTVFFVFISGFLFHHVFYHRWDYKKYMKNKTKFVFLPYLLLSLPWIVWHLTVGTDPMMHKEMADISGPAAAASWYVITGRTLTAYWYIPMGMMLFALSPWVMHLIKKQQVLYYAIPLLLIAIMVHRPISNLNAIQSLVYFLPVYLLGVWGSAHRDKLFPFIDKYWLAMLLTGIALALIQAQFFGAGTLNKAPFEMTVPDLMLPQKILLTLVILAILNKFEHISIAPLQKLAEVSFAIYFIHPWITTPWWMIYDSPDLFGLANNGNIFTTLLVTLVVVAISYLIAIMIKKLLSKRSRYLIGW
ncbi:acyltransferase [Shewanella sp. 1CM18E]|uniref:acyltransferase family protein n=1 Tax=Shewanella sp. 1CM18E TaxID=2929169 RepID=UPI0020BF69EB|nr:acyltransferase [Shewanella sp. 1CM18E]MCK8043538.1 acyltransferase [Shewanella sp. 1CM18E]